MLRFSAYCDFANSIIKFFNLSSIFLCASTVDLSNLEVTGTKLILLYIRGPIKLLKFNEKRELKT